MQGEECCPGGEAGAGRGHGDSCVGSLWGHPAERSLRPQWAGVSRPRQGGLVSPPPFTHTSSHRPLPCRPLYPGPAQVYHGYAVRTSCPSHLTAPWPGQEVARPRYPGHPSTRTAPSDSSLRQLFPRAPAAFPACLPAGISS